MNHEHFTLLRQWYYVLGITDGYISYSDPILVSKEKIMTEI